MGSGSDERDDGRRGEPVRAASGMTPDFASLMADLGESVRAQRAFIDSVKPRVFRD